jgi:hypothetical protein
MARKRGARAVSIPGSKRVLLVLFVPSVERDGKTPVGQQAWVDASLEMFGMTFGGATAYPQARGVWRDDERDNVLVWDDPVVVHCYTSPQSVMDDGNLGLVAAFCRRMGRETRQGEVGLIVDNQYHAFRNFEEP